MVRKGSLFAPIVLGVVVFLFTAMAPSAGFADTQGKIEGTWRVSITGGPGTPPLPDWYGALATFIRGGALIQTITDPFIGTGHGQWIKVHSRDFAITTFLFQFDASGNFLGTLKARATLTLNDKGDEFTSDKYLFEFFDPDGHLQTSGVGKAHGTRIQVEPLP